MSLTDCSAAMNGKAMKKKTEKKLAKTSGRAGRRYEREVSRYSDEELSEESEASSESEHEEDYSSASDDSDVEDARAPAAYRGRAVTGSRAAPVGDRASQGSSSVASEEAGDARVAQTAAAAQKVELNSKVILFSNTASMQELADSADSKGYVNLALTGNVFPGRENHVIKEVKIESVENTHKFGVALDIGNIANVTRGHASSAGVEAAYIASPQSKETPGITVVKANENQTVFLRTCYGWNAENIEQGFYRGEKSAMVENKDHPVIKVVNSARSTYKTAAPLRPSHEGTYTVPLSEFEPAMEFLRKGLTERVRIMNANTISVRLARSEVPSREDDAASIAGATENPWLNTDEFASGFDSSAAERERRLKGRIAVRVRVDYYVASAQTPAGKAK